MTGRGALQGLSHRQQGAQGPQAFVAGPTSCQVFHDHQHQGSCLLLEATADEIESPKDLRK